jgi:hypothetical protein
MLLDLFVWALGFLTDFDSVRLVFKLAISLLVCTVRAFKDSRDIKLKENSPLPPSRLILAEVIY